MDRASKLGEDRMRVGVVFPQTEIAADAAVIRDWAQAVEGLGFDHVIAYDHVMGANLASRPDWTMPYNHDTPFHEPITLFSFLAGVTTTLELASGIIILPQRQTALFAKQAANADVFSGGRLRLEPDRVRGARRAVPGPRRAVRRAGGPAAQALDRRTGHL